MTVAKPEPATAATLEVGGTPNQPMPAAPTPKPAPVPEIGGPSGPEPTRFGDWERNGRCSDF